MEATHVHPNPGYHDYDISIKRAAQAPELLSSKQYIEDTSFNNSRDACPMGELSEIKSWAKRTWSGKDRRETTYQFQYRAKELDERTPSAPTERQRANKPHPKPMFLTNRLHHVPGYHNADSTLGKSPYLPDSLCSSDEQKYRIGLKSKYDGGISDAATRQYAPKEECEITKWNRTLPPNDSWMAAGSPYKGRTGSKQLIRSLDDAVSEAARNHASEIASHNRYLRLAGPEERARIHRALDASHDQDKVPNMMIPYQTKGSLSTQRQTDKANFQANPNKPLYRFPRPRGDFLIHPVWPPSIWHHRIPGFKADPPANGITSAFERHQQQRLSGVY